MRAVTIWGQERSRGYYATNMGFFVFLRRLKRLNLSGTYQGTTPPSCSIPQQPTIYDVGKCHDWGREGVDISMLWWKYSPMNEKA